MKSNAWVIGFICGLLIVAVICFIMGYWQKKKYGKSDEYDERQNAVRGQAYKLSFFAALITAIAGGLMDMAFGLSWLGLFPFAMLIVWISVCVFATYAILHDAYFSLRARRKTLKICFLFIGLANMILGAIEIFFETGLMTDGMLNTSAVNLLTGLCCSYLGGLLLYKSHSDRKAADDE